MGFITKAIVIIMVQILIAVPVIQNINNVKKICFEGDFAKSQALFSSTSVCVPFFPEDLTEISVIEDLYPNGSFRFSF
jgi:hypothetical protein